jgi:hypothetical protein
VHPRRRDRKRSHGAWRGLWRIWSFEEWIDNPQLALTTASRTPEGSARGKGFLDNFVCDKEGLADQLEAAREPLVLDPLEPKAGMVGFFEHETHFWGELETAPVRAYRAVFCGGRRDAPDQLSGGHLGLKFRNEIIDEIEQSAQETCCGINTHITIEYNVILFGLIVNAEIVPRSKRTIR